MQPEQVYYAISKQERQVLWLIAQDQPNRLIADKLCVSPHTVKNHKANLIKKLGLCSTTALHHLAIQASEAPIFKNNFEGRGGNSLIINILNQFNFIKSHIKDSVRFFMAT